MLLSCVVVAFLACLTVHSVSARTSKLAYTGDIGCDDDSFVCNDGSCIPQEWECDDFGDCPEGEEEIGCPPCPSGRFRCNGGPGKLCLPGTWQCDGQEQCSDGSDEADCQVPTEPPTEAPEGCDGFECVINGFCIPDTWQCDHEADCVDGSDEVGCPTTADPLLSCFEESAGMALYGFNDVVLTDTNLEQCLEHCLGNGNCSSVDHVSRSDRCYISSESHLTQPAHFGPHEGSDYYYKLC